MLKHLAIAAVGLLMMAEQCRSIESREGKPAIIKAGAELHLEALRQSAEQGDADAQFALAQRYLRGGSPGLPRDHAAAALWFRKAAEQGSSTSQLNLGWMYYRGEGVLQDYTEAARWFRKAAEQGDARGQLNLGRVYVAGKGVPKDYVLAYKWFNLSAAAPPPPRGTGSDTARIDRDRLAHRMTTDQIAEAQRLAREWVAAR